MVSLFYGTFSLQLRPFKLPLLISCFVLHWVWNSDLCLAQFTSFLKDTICLWIAMCLPILGQQGNWGLFLPFLTNHYVKKKLISIKKLPTMADLLRQAQFWKWDKIKRLTILQLDCVIRHTKYYKSVSIKCFIFFTYSCAVTKCEIQNYLYDSKFQSVQSILH